MATQAHSTTATIIPFPRRPTEPHGLFDQGRWMLCGRIVCAFGQFDGLSPSAIESCVRSMIGVDKDDLADLLTDATFAKSFLTAALTSLSKLDALVAEAVDRVLAESGL